MIHAYLFISKLQNEEKKKLYLSKIDRGQQHIIASK